MIKRNCFGKIEPTLGSYYIQKCNRGYEIMKHDAYCNTNAVLRNEVFMWIEINPFSSMVQAYKFLKENIDNLM